MLMGKSPIRQFLASYLLLRIFSIFMRGKTTYLKETDLRKMWRCPEQHCQN